MDMPRTDPINSFDTIDVAAVRADIEHIGYSIVPDVIDDDVLIPLREFWLTEFAKPVPIVAMVWGPFLGEPNGAVFDEAPTHSFYRSFDYLWNPPYDPLTRDTALALNRVRNRLIGEDDRYGELFDPDRYGIYITTSYYPCGSGRLHMHPDTARRRCHWHFVLPLTFRGTHYGSGGLVLTDREGTLVDIDGLATSGSVIFYDGTLVHGVDQIEGTGGLEIGRLQLFAIPTFFELPQQNQRQVAAIPAAAYLRAKLSRLKWRLIKGGSR